ncbi:uncharacterized protein LOC143036668 [Oratosquilla oratoria]|uniref:uncharacterized protein LOC143036668 n=1 Tax=Oratosquilla oratoria TaxID=337810 RepID=UPI003F773A9D
MNVGSGLVSERDLEEGSDPTNLRPENESPRHQEQQGGREEGRFWQTWQQPRGATGPSGLDTSGWKCLLSTSLFGTAAGGLQEAIAGLAKKLATEDCQHLEAYTACRLIPLDKKPGCRPIGIGEVLRIIIGKTIMEVAKDEVREAAGNLQVCAGQQAGSEAEVYAMRKIFEEPDCEAILLVDASNTFNNLNREATIHNIKIKCPILARYVENTYREPANLFVTNRSLLVSPAVDAMLPLCSVSLEHQVPSCHARTIMKGEKEEETAFPDLAILYEFCP